jgi:hypothetical protein
MSTLKKRVQELQLEASKLRSEIVDVEHRLAKIERELTRKREKHAGLILRLNDEISALEKQARAEQIEIDVSEFFAVARKLDAAGGADPGLHARFLYLTKLLRGKRHNTSHEVVSLSVGRLRSEPGAPPLPVALRSWSGLAASWIKPAPQEEKAA